jgi:hypothetical protein
VSEPTTRIRRFNVPSRWDGADGLKVEIVIGGREPLFRVRPARRRTAVEVPLGDVAEIVLERDAKARAAEKARERKRGRA